LENAKLNELSSSFGGDRWKMSDLGHCRAVLFAFMVLGLIVMFRDEKKLKAAAIGGAIVGRRLDHLSVSRLPAGRHFFVDRHPHSDLSVALFYVVLMYISRCQDGSLHVGHVPGHVANGRLCHPGGGLHVAWLPTLRADDV